MGVSPTSTFGPASGSPLILNVGIDEPPRSIELPDMSSSSSEDSIGAITFSADVLVGSDEENALDLVKIKDSSEEDDAFFASFDVEPQPVSDVESQPVENPKNSPTARRAGLVSAIAAIAAGIALAIFGGVTGHFWLTGVGIAVGMAGSIGMRQLLKPQPAEEQDSAEEQDIEEELQLFFNETRGLEEEEVGLD